MREVAKVGVTPRRVAASIAAALALHSSIALAFNNGNQIFDAMNEPKRDVEVLLFLKGLGAGLAIGYEDAKVAGVGQGAAELDICMAEGVTLGQVRDTIHKYLTQHPEIRHHGMATLYLAIMRRAYPCR